MVLAEMTGNALPKDTAVDTQRSQGFKHSQHQQAFTLHKRVESSPTMTSLLTVYYPTCRSRVGRNFTSLWSAAAKANECIGARFEPSEISAATSHTHMKRQGAFHFSRPLSRKANKS